MRRKLAGGCLPAARRERRTPRDPNRLHGAAVRPPLSRPRPAGGPPDLEGRTHGVTEMTHRSEIRFSSDRRCGFRPVVGGDEPGFAPKADPVGHVVNGLEWPFRQLPYDRALAWRRVRGGRSRSSRSGRHRRRLHRGSSERLRTHQNEVKGLLRLCSREIIRRCRARPRGFRKLLVLGRPRGTDT